ncbi:MAG: hypothetical protein OEX21_07455 [Betaproteobacteria bacterium]|nr:hypothetical protein [Betaproteobacteria bacterium]
MSNASRGLRIAAGICALSLALFPAAAGAQTKPSRTEVGGEPPQSLMWVGNSFFYYNNSMHNHYGRIAREVDGSKRYRSVSVTISGSGIDWHDLDTYLRPGLIGKYSFAAGNEVVFNKPGRQFDAVMMMDCSQCPIHPQLKGAFTDFARKNSEIVKNYGARPVFFMSWAYKDKPEMTATLAEAYTVAGNANDALVVPAGLAFAKAIAKRPSLELYEPDKRHPSLVGTYLAACTTYAALWKKSPVDIKYTAGLDPELAAFLRTVAWETVNEYYGK